MTNDITDSAGVRLGHQTVERLKALGSVVLGMLLLFSVWLLAIGLTDLPPYILPHPVDVLQALYSGLAVPITSKIGYYMPLWATLSSAFLGLAIGSSLGILLGALMAEFRMFEKIFMPYAFALQSLPKIAIAPLIIIWCGFGESSKVVMAAMLTFFPMLVNSFAGLRSTQPERVELMKVLSASRLETFLRVKLPSAAPFIFAGFDMAVVYSLLGTIVAEFLGAQKGMGVVIVRAQAVTDTTGVFAALIVLGAVGILLHLIVKGVEKKIIHWGERI